MTFGSKSWHTLGSWTTNCMKYYPDPTWQWGTMTWAQIWVCVHYDLDIRDMTFGQGHGTPLVMDNNHVKYYPYQTWQWRVMTHTRIFGICALWHWTLNILKKTLNLNIKPWRYDLGSRSWHTLGSWTTIVWNIIQIQLGSEELWPGRRFRVCVYCDLDPGNMTLGQSPVTPLGHRQQLCEILSRLTSG